MLSGPPSAARTALGLKKLPMMLWRVLRGGSASAIVASMRSDNSESLAFSRRLGGRKGRYMWGLLSRVKVL